MTTWPALLDTIDEGLVSFPPVLVDLDAIAPALGPLPPSLAARVAATLRRMAGAEALLEQHRADLARELVALAALDANPRGAGTAPVPHFLDTKA